MCGIAGAINLQLDLSVARDSLLHRGPDEQGSFIEPPVSFYHLRLAIQGIADGKQPMELGSLVIAYNGEIYNHLELRAKYDLQCRTPSDTETLLHLYAKLGISCLDEIDGMFAFALFDRASGKVSLVRDRAGKKPLYINSTGNGFVFSSELNSLSRLTPLKVDDARIAGYLCSGSFYGQETPYENTIELPAGSYMEIDVKTNQSSIQRWWSLDKLYQTARVQSLEEELESVEAILLRSVKRRLLSSDLEVGCFLSGGIDSGLITAMAASQVSQLKTYTVSLGGAFDESALAKTVADRYNTQHTQISINFDNLRDDVEGILLSYGEPFVDSSAIPSYYVCQAASEHQTVVLNGDGADELFAGYRRYVPYSRINLFAETKLLSGAVTQFLKLMPAAKDKSSMYTYVHRLLNLIKEQGVDRYLSSTGDIFVGANDLLEHPNACSEELQSMYASVANQKLSSLQKMMLLDFHAQLGGNLLPKMDIASMQHSLEARSPFLGKELFEYAAGLNDKYKINKGTTKYILRQLAKKYLPNDVVHAPKRGFESPLQQWIDGELKELIVDRLSSNNAYTRHFISKQNLDTVLGTRSGVSSQKRAKMLWALFTVEVWSQGLHQKTA